VVSSGVSYFRNRPRKGRANGRNYNRYLTLSKIEDMLSPLACCNNSNHLRQENQLRQRKKDLQGNLWREIVQFALNLLVKLR
jgi:hypothetical protein